MLRNLAIVSLALMGGLAFAQRGAAPSGVVRADNTPITDRMGIDQKLGNQVPGDVLVYDSSGEKKTFGDLYGKRPLLVMPMFFQCQGICLVEQDSLLKTLVKMKPAVGETFDVVMLSIHPKESPDLAKVRKNQVLDLYELGRKNRNSSAGKREDWHYLTAPKESIDAITDALGFRFDYNERTGNINHPAGIMILTPEGKVSSYIYGKDYPTRVVEDDVRVAQEGRIGKEADVILLGCVRIDPHTGQRTLIVENVLRLLGIVTVISLVTSILVMNRKYKANPPAGGGAA